MPRSDYKDDGKNVLLDANENAFGPALSKDFTEASSGSNVDVFGLHRYPDPHQEDLKRLLCDLRNTNHHTSKPLAPENLFVGVGSDEAIDSLLRAFCVPGRDRILTCPPTYGMYAVSAQVNDVGIVKVPLKPSPGFDLDVDAVLDALSSEKDIKIVYLCSPGNPTSTLIPKSDVQKVLSHPTWNGVVVLDEAYIDFAPENASLAQWATEFPNLVVMQTLSKAFGLAGIRLGAAFTSPAIARVLNSLKAPYNIAQPTSIIAREAVSRGGGLAVMRAHVDQLNRGRERLLEELPRIEGVGRHVGGKASNFLMFEMLDKDSQPSNETALAVYERLAETKGVVVRFRGKEHGCLGCLRITVGTDDEITKFLEALRRTLSEVRDSRQATDQDEEQKKETEANNVVA